MWWCNFEKFQKMYYIKRIKQRKTTLLLKKRVYYRTIYYTGNLQSFNSEMKTYR